MQKIKPLLVQKESVKSRNDFYNDANEYDHGDPIDSDCEADDDFGVFSTDTFMDEPVSSRVRPSSTSAYTRIRPNHKNVQNIDGIMWE